MFRTLATFTLYRQRTMPKKNTTKLKKLNKNKNKKKRKQQRKQQQNEKENKKQEKAFARELRNRESLYEKQKEEIEIVSTMYELTPILTPSSQIIQMNDDNLLTATMATAIYQVLMRKKNCIPIYLIWKLSHILAKWRKTTVRSHCESGT